MVGVNNLCLMDSKKTQLWYMTSKYGNFCGKDVLDARQAVSDSERYNQCSNCLCGCIILPFIPVLIIGDILSFPIRKLINCCGN
jgi:hypothetical protein